MKIEEAVQGLQAFAFCVLNVNSTVVLLFWTFWKKNWLCLASWALFILKLYKAFQTTVQTAMISKVMIKFQSKFQFQIPLQFYRTAEKVDTCDGNGQKYWQLPPIFSTFPLWLLFCFFMIEI